MVAVRLEEVFKLNGIPSYTYVEPVEYSRLLVALRTAGRGVVVEGPSGVGKTTAVVKALEKLEQDHIALSARRAADRGLIEEIPRLTGSGVVIIDDFHRLSDDTKSEIADYLKVLADEEDESTKVVIIGINRAGESLLNFARDLRGRVDVIKFERNSDEKVHELVSEGAKTLRISLPVDEIVKSAVGSFHLAQLLSYTACLMSGVTQRASLWRDVEVPVQSVRERVQDEQAMSFMDPALKFAAGPRFSKEGRAPYLHMLRWLSESEEWTISLQRELRRHPTEETSVSAVINGGHLEEFLDKNVDLQELIHFDPRTKVLAVEDPKFFYFIRNLEWARFAERVGFLNIGYKSRYDFALSFAAPERPFAEELSKELTALEFSVFYDSNEQARILATDIEAYLAPIYASEATYVVSIMGASYPDRVWTRFEGKQFRTRFGSEAVIPAWYQGAAPTLFDPMREIGSFVIDPTCPVVDEAKRFAKLLAEKVSDYRLGPRVPLNAFLCRGCNLILPYGQRATTQTSLCLDCAERVLAGASG